MLYSSLVAAIVALASVAHATPNSNEPRADLGQSFYYSHSPDGEYPRDGNLCGSDAQRAAGWVWCDYECGDRSANKYHCGTCYHSCQGGECRNGECVSE